MNAMNTMLTRTCAVVPALILGLSCLPVDPARAERGGPTEILTVGPDTGCDYADLQTAINAAQNGAELRLRNTTFTGNFSIFGKDLSLRGGYESCNATSPTFSSTLDADNSGRPLTIGQSMTATEVTLVDLVLENGDSVSRGGGLLIDGSEADHEATLDDVTVRFNSSDSNGGAIYLFGDGDHRLTIRGDTLVFDNAAGNEGGGIYCSGRDGAGLVILEDGTLLGNESTNEGGGISLHDCNLFTEPGARIASNIGGSVGGGVAAIGSSFVRLDGDGSDVLVSNSVSSSTGDGGGLFVADTATAEVINAVIRDNSASTGGGIFARGDATVTMGYDSNGTCPPPDCSRLSDNSGEAGAALFVTDNASVAVRQSRITGNTASNEAAVAAVSGGALYIESSFIYGNSGVLVFRMAFEGDLSIVWSSLADNIDSTDSSELIRLIADDQTATSLSLYSNIIHDPGRNVLAINDTFGSNFTTDFDCLLSHELASIDGETRSQVVSDPKFVDSAAGDYHIMPSSAAVDFCDDTHVPTGGDIDGQSRGFPLAAGLAFDVGADEFNDGLFRDRFESNP